MKDFNSYVNSSGNGQSGRESGGGDAGGIDVATVLNALAGKYEGADEQEIISAIIAEAERGRANGTLTDETLKSFEATVSPILSPVQRKKLNKIVRYLLKS